MELRELVHVFAKAFGTGPAGAVRAPGRVNLIGEHTDYNDGYVMPIAIERRTVALFAPHAGKAIRLASAQSEDVATIDLSKPITPGEPKWANYCRGVATGLVARGVKVGGCDVLFQSDIPIGGGLSSSAALEVATALALLSAAGAAGTVPQRELALLCQKAEHEFAGAPCGIMDQSISLMGQAGRALLLDCRDSTVRQLHFDNPAVVVLVVDTQVKHAISDGGYAARREQCHSAARKLGVQSLREADLAMIVRAGASLTDKERMRARHIVTEIARTVDAADALESGDYEEFGRLMYGSHESLKDDFEVSCDELDEIVGAASRCTGVYGARMTGGGFGGCAIILAKADNTATIQEAVTAAFQRRFGRLCPIFATRAAAGAGDIALP